MSGLKLIAKGCACLAAALGFAGLVAGCTGINEFFVERGAIASANREEKKRGQEKQARLAEELGDLQKLASNLANAGSHPSPADLGALTRYGSEFAGKTVRVSLRIKGLSPVENLWFANVFGPGDAWEKNPYVFDVSPAIIKQRQLTEWLSLRDVAGRCEVFVYQRPRTTAGFSTPVRIYGMLLSVP